MSAAIIRELDKQILKHKISSLRKLLCNKIKIGVINNDRSKI